jgi:CheY-like chemotaxis protein
MKLKNVLIIDDDEIINYIHNKVLIKSDICSNIKICLNGLEALQYLNELNDSFPELIFLDINMPIKDAWGFLEEFEKNPNKSNTKVIILSTSENPDDKLKAQKYSSVISFKNKPLSLEMVKEIIANFKEIQ